jgi:hypothetical protein
MVLALVPFLISGVAAAAPGYPVENPPSNPFTVTYDTTSHVLTLTTSITEDSGAAVSGVDGTTGDVATTVVEGPNGQINHGQIVRQVHELVEGQQLGCVTRVVAKSDLGKGDQQVRPNEPSTESNITESVDPAILEGECPSSNQSNKPASTSASDHPSKNGDKSQGKSKDAPGQNK